MKIALSCIGKFHHFDLARQLHARGYLDKIYTGYPRWKLKREGLPMNRIVTFPWFHTVYMAQGRMPFASKRLSGWLAELARRSHDRFVTRKLEPCDVFIGLSGQNLYAGRRAKALGALWICDRGSTHILNQAEVLGEEHSRWGVSFPGIPLTVIAQELREYAEADFVTIPSRVVRGTFVDRGVSSGKLKVIPYGVDLSMFRPTGRPVTGRFDVIFVGGVNLRKGIPYLIEAYRGFSHPAKSLTIVGSLDPAFSLWMSKIKDTDIRVVGHIPQPQLKDLLSKSHVFVLPSVEEGLALVQAQALACGCPLICSENTGGADLIDDGVEGFVVPSRSVEMLTEKMRFLASNPLIRNRMAEAATRRVALVGGWNEYGEKFADFLKHVIPQKYDRA